MRLFGSWKHALRLAGAFALICGSAVAQPPAYPPYPGGPLPAAGVPDEAAAVHSCLCLQRAMQAMQSTMTAKTEALGRVRAQLDELNREVRSARARVDINDPSSIARFKALLARRDAAYQRSLGPIVSDASQSVAAYNARVRQYNEQCAGRPFDSVLMNRMEATLSCPEIR